MPGIDAGLLRRIRLTTGKKMNSALAGEYHSAFRGFGLSFDSVREYQYGDDVRSIDWNVSARMDHLYVKNYIEERELSVVLLIDLSASTDFTSGARSKGEIIIETSALLLALAGLNNDRVSVGLFSDTLEAYFRPIKGRRGALRLLDEITRFKPRSRKTSVVAAIDALSRIQKKRSIVFIVSDFIDDDPNLYHKMKRLALRHDVIPVMVKDPAEERFPLPGLVALLDLESGNFSVTDALPGASRPSRDFGVETLRISTSDRLDLALLEFFQKRSRQKRVR